MDFKEFIELHYSNHTTHDLDHEEDAQLPFKCPDLHFPTQMNIATENIGHFTLIPAISIKKSYCITEVTSLPAPYLSKIFQPPKAA